MNIERALRDIQATIMVCAAFIIFALNGDSVFGFILLVVACIMQIVRYNEISYAKKQE